MVMTLYNLSFIKIGVAIFYLTCYTTCLIASRTFTKVYTNETGYLLSFTGLCWVTQTWIIEIPVALVFAFRQSNLACSQLRRSLLSLSPEIIRIRWRYPLKAVFLWRMRFRQYVGDFLPLIIHNPVMEICAHVPVLLCQKFYFCEYDC